MKWPRTLLWIGLAALSCAVMAAVSFAAGGYRQTIPGIFANGDQSAAIALDAATTTIRWAGYSTTSYTGTVGGTGFKSANTICNTLYPGSHWANSDEIIRLGTQYPWSLNAWLADFYFDGALDCSHFSSTSGSSTATNVSTVTIYGGGTNSGWTCTNSLYLACVYQP